MSCFHPHLLLSFSMYLRKSLRNLRFSLIQVRVSAVESTHILRLFIVIEQRDCKKDLWFHMGMIRYPSV